MQVRRFFGPTARDALRQVKEALGPDAIVLANRSVNGGVEITAVPPSALTVLEAPRQPAPRPAPEPAKAAPALVREPRAAAAPGGDEDFHLSLSQSVMRRYGVEPPAPPRVAPARAPEPKPVAQSVPQRPLPVREAAPARPVPQAAVARPVPMPPEPRLREPEGLFASRAPAANEQPPRPSRPAPAPRAAEPAAAPRKEAAPQPLPEALGRELQAIRAMIEHQLAGFAWGSMSRDAPVRSLMLGELLDSGFSPALARRLAESVDGSDALGNARTAVRNWLNRSLRTLGSDDDLINQGGVFALCGPTGVGKTTTTAKLAARCVVRHGADKVALITTDSYRIGAHEQLRIYGRILGVSVQVVRDGADLKQTLRDLRHKHMVLIDTVGMSQRDRAVAEQAAMLVNAGEVRRLLLLNATSRGDTLDDVVKAYDGPDLAGVVLTKVDEAASLAPVLDVAIRHDLALFYIANGQRVPEDLHLPNRAYLLHRALKELPEGSPHRTQGLESGLIVAGARSAAAMAETIN